MTPIIYTVGMKRRCGAEMSPLDLYRPVDTSKCQEAYPSPSLAPTDSNLIWASADGIARYRSPDRPVKQVSASPFGEPSFAPRYVAVFGCMHNADAPAWEEMRQERRMACREVHEPSNYRW